MERNSLVVLEIGTVLGKHRVWERHMMRTCELEMPNWSLHRPSHSKSVGPGWTWMNEITMSDTKLNNRRR